MTTLIDNLAKGLTTDLTDESASSFTRELPRAGGALMRLRDYIEMGVVQPKNPTYKPRVEALLTFELLHPDHMITPEGKPPFPQLLYVRVPKAHKGNSNFIKLFKKMNHSKTKTHFVQMIGEAFLGMLEHNKSGDKTYVNLNDKSGSWNIGAPVQLDAINNTETPIPVPEMHGTPKVFCWEEKGWSDEDIKTAWDTLFIETPEGAEKSSNWIQESIQESLEYQGSRTQSVVESGIVELPTALATETVAPPATVPEDTAQPTATPAQTPVDPLAQLGI